MELGDVAGLFGLEKILHWLSLILEKIPDYGGKMGDVLELPE